MYWVFSLTLKNRQKTPHLFTIKGVKEINIPFDVCVCKLILKDTITFKTCSNNTI